MPGRSTPLKAMPLKAKPRKTNDSAGDLWVAPRAASQKPPRIYEPVSGSRLNRYLEFADIALGAKAPAVRKKRAVKTGGSPAKEKFGSKLGSKLGSLKLESKFESKTVSITHGRRGFGAFRNSR
jgi:hypothetical protein